MRPITLSGLIVAALAFASGAATFCLSGLSGLSGLWREVSTRIARVLAKFGPMIHARPGVQIVRAVAHQATFMHRSLSRREADYLRMCA